MKYFAMMLLLANVATPSPAAAGSLQACYDKVAKGFADCTSWMSKYGYDTKYCLPLLKDGHKKCLAQ
ncbi:MAG: hypothetical protein KGM42_08640 [Hyphomicrobiales bacterium]|nr:hypothetical protein [Hyphomicrobiales bacterium]